MAHPPHDFQSAEEPLDCRRCGACCHDASDGRVLVSAQDLVRWRRSGRTDIVDGLVPGHFSQLAFPARADGSCRHLGGADGLYTCTIYETRGESCRALEPGSPQCLAYRRAAFA